MTSPYLSRVQLQLLGELELIRSALNEQLNIIKDQNRCPANRTNARAFVALLIYNDLVLTQAAIDNILADPIPEPVFFADGN